MSRKKRTPQYSHHKASGQAVVRIDGHDVYLGKHGTPESHAKYAQTINEWRVKQQEATAARNSQTLQAPARSGAAIPLSEMLLAYWSFAKTHYVRQGQPTSELTGMRAVIKPLKSLYGSSPAHEFGPLALKAVRQFMIESNLCRTEINKRINRIKRIFKWAVSEELIPPSVHQALQTVAGLQFDRTEARESDPVNPVERKHVDAILPLVSGQVAAMIELQALTGMRPGEVVQLRPCDIEQSDEIWIFRPASHKNQYRGHNREVPLGPRAQAILSPFMDRDPARHCFSPAEAEAERNAKLCGTIADGRKTKVYPSEVKSRQQRKEQRATQTRKRPPKDFYEVASYRRAITYGIKKAQKSGLDVEHWHPHQLRHLRATQVRRDHGIEAAQASLGHKRTDATEIYAQKNLDKAIEVAKASG